MLRLFLLIVLLFSCEKIKYETTAQVELRCQEKDSSSFSSEMLIRKIIVKDLDECREVSKLISPLKNKTPTLQVDCKIIIHCTLNRRIGEHDYGSDFIDTTMFVKDSTSYCSKQLGTNVEICLQ